MQLLQWFSGLTLILTLALLVFVGFAFVDAAIRPSSSYVAAGKLTKQAWLLILGVAFACAFAFGIVSFVGAATIVAALVYCVDVRPALIAVRGGGGSSQGPYGPW